LTERTVRKASTIVLGTLLVFGCGGGSTTAKLWCDAHLDAVSTVGIKDGKQFDFGTSRPAISWPEFASDSDIERSVILNESLNGADIFDTACREAYAAK
jgi:hypothetical protein